MILNPNLVRLGIRHTGAGASTRLLDTESIR